MMPVRMRARLFGFLLLFGFTTAFGATASIDAPCPVAAVGNDIAQQLNMAMRQRLDREMRAAAKIFDMNCLMGLIRYGGLGFFSNGDFLGGLSGALCHAVLNWLGSAEPRTPESMQRMLAHVAAMDRAPRIAGVSQ